MRFGVYIAVLCLGTLLGGCVHGELKAVSEKNSVPFIRNGEAVGVIIVANSARPNERDAVEHFVKTAEQSTGVRIPVLRDGEALDPWEGYSRLYIGNCKATEEAGIRVEDGVEETYVMDVRGDAVFIVGSTDDGYWRSAGVRSRPVLWALNRLLEDQLGVRWLWPGELGTHIPSHTDFSIPRQHVVYQPELMIRWLRINLRDMDERRMASVDPELEVVVRQEASAWLENHQVARRGNVSFGHAFTDWWDKYSADYPDYFAVPPEGLPQRHARYVNLQLANPAVIDRIVQEYIEAGAPEYYNVSPNDGAGFDTSPETRAWDIPLDQDIHDIWFGRGELTARYVKFWNLLYERLSDINPDVKMATYAYSAYRQPPPPERPLTARLFIGIVDTYDNYDGWSGWSDSGSEMMLRPNWWFQGGNAPYIPLTKTGDFIRFAARNGMKAMDMDSILGYWSTQGINYYQGARLMTRPDLSTEEIIAEYTSAFGDASEDIREYFRYWEEVTDEYNYPMNATGGIRPESVSSRYDDLVRQKKIPLSILNGVKYALPYLYTDEVIAPAAEILEQAYSKVDPDSIYARRIEFLQDGLVELALTRDVIALGQQLKKKHSPELMEEFIMASREMEEFREALTRDHVVWAETVKWHEDRYRVLIRPENLHHHNIELDGL